MITEIIQVFLKEKQTTLTIEKQKSFIKIFSGIGEASSEQIRLLRQREADGLWLALEMPTDLAEKLVDVSQQELTPIIAEFGDCQIQQLSVHVPASLQRVDEQNILLIKLLYLSLAEVVVEQELMGGFSGALLQPG